MFRIIGAMLAVWSHAEVVEAGEDTRMEGLGFRRESRGILATTTGLFWDDPFEGVAADRLTSRSEVRERSLERLLRTHDDRAT